MEKRHDIYNYAGILKRALVNLESSGLHEENKNFILEFHRIAIAEGLSLARTIKYVVTLQTLARLLGKPFSDATKEDVIELIRKLEVRDYSDWTKRDYKVILKRFYKWIKKSETYPEEVSWIKARAKNHHLLPEELLTEDEVKRIADAAFNPRDKAFVLVLYETGCRIGEILSLQIKHVQPDEYGAVLLVNGKTGHRRVRIISSAPELTKWLEYHPLKNDPYAPLWTSFGSKNKNVAFAHSSVREMLKDLARRANVKKRIYPHLFRHSRATHLANHLTDAQLKHHLGWVQNSAMSATYIHLSGKDVDNALFKLNGLEVNEETKKSEFKTKVCGRCKTKNSPTGKFCSMCGLPLDVKTAIEIDETREKADALMNELVKNPKVLDALLEGVEKLKNEEDEKDKNEEYLKGG